MLKSFFNQRAASWDEISKQDMTKLEQMSRRLSIKPGSTLLDVGTGTGVFLPFLLSKIGHNGQIVALDFAGEMLKIARTKDFSRNVDYLCADITNIPFDDEVFDAVVCHACFPHFQDKPGALSEMHRVAKGGGRLFICHTSSRAEINGMHRAIPAVQNDLIPDRTEMQEMLSTAGFTDIEIEDGSESYLCRSKKRYRRREL